MPSETEQPNSNLKDMTKKNIRNFFKDSSELKIHSSSKRSNATEIEPDYIETVSNIYKEVLNKSPDIGNLKYYANQLKFKIITEDRLRQTLKESEESKENNNKETNILPHSNNNISSNDIELVYCMMGTNRLDEIKPYIETVLKYVDKFVFIDGSDDDIKDK